MVAANRERHGHVSPEDLFLLASSLGDRLPDLTYFVEDEAVSRHRVSLPRLGQAQFFGSGRQLATHFHNQNIWDEFCSCFEVPKKGCSRLVVRDLFTAFLAAGGDAPAAVHGYAICWRDRAVIERWGLRLDGKLQRVHIANPSQPVQLAFHDGRPKVAVTPADFDWLTPGGVASSSLGFLHSRERRDTVDGEQWLGESFREDLFPSYPGWTEDVPPSLIHDDTFSLVLSGEHRLPVISPPGRSDAGDEHVAGIGILNVLLLNGWRLYKKNTPPFGLEYRIDELVLALHRPTRRVAYIATTNSRLYFGLHHDRNRFEDSRLGLYLLDRGRRSSGVTWCITPTLSP